MTESGDTARRISTGAARPMSFTPHQRYALTALHASHHGTWYGKSARAVASVERSGRASQHYGDVFTPLANVYARLVRTLQPTAAEWHRAGRPGA